MNLDITTTLLLFSIPALIVGTLAYYFFSAFLKQEKNNKEQELYKSTIKESLLIRLQAYERLILFLERIRPSQLMIRVRSNSSNVEDYAYLLIQHIDQEFNHNLAQQIYVSETCWSTIVTSKNATIQLIRQAKTEEKINVADDLREAVLMNVIKKQAPTDAAIACIKQEVAKIIRV